MPKESVREVCYGGEGDRGDGGNDRARSLPIQKSLRRQASDPLSTFKIGPPSSIFERLRSDSDSILPGTMVPPDSRARVLVSGSHDPARICARSTARSIQM